MGQDLGAEDEYANLLPEEHFWPHFKPAIDINNVIDQTFYTEGTWQSFLFKYQTYDFVLNAYTPPLFLNDFWLTSDKLQELNETTKTLRLTY